MTHGSCGGSPAQNSHQPTHASAMNRLAHTEAASPKVNELLFEPRPTSTRSMSWVWATALTWSICAATVRPFSRFAEGFAMSCGWPPEQARLKRSWMPARSACSSEEWAERWQKKALLLGADQPGNPCAHPVEVGDRLVVAAALAADEAVAERDGRGRQVRRAGASRARRRR